MCCGLGHWGRRGFLPLSDLDGRSRALPLFEFSGAALTVKGKGKVVGRCPTPCHLLKKVDENFRWLAVRLCSPRPFIRILHSRKEFLYAPYLYLL